jgi:hypothetical protein
MSTPNLSRPSIKVIWLQPQTHQTLPVVPCLREQATAATYTLAIVAARTTAVSLRAERTRHASFGTFKPIVDTCGVVYSKGVCNIS